jgi:hypothetical protein
MPLLDLFWAMLWFFLFFAWIWLLISVFGDIFRSDDMGGWGKAGWIVLVVLAPFLGVFIYLIARGGSMAERNMQRAAENAQAQQEYIRQVAGTSGSSTADELSSTLRRPPCSPDGPAAGRGRGRRTTWMPPVP